MGTFSRGSSTALLALLLVSGVVVEADNTVYDSIETVGITGLPYRGATCRKVGTGIQHDEQTCPTGFVCFGGYCVDFNTIKFNEIKHEVAAPSNVQVGFSVVGTLPDGSCVPVLLDDPEPGVDLSNTAVTDRIFVLEDGNLASDESYTVTTGVSPTKYQNKIFMLVDQSDSITDKDSVRLALMTFVDNLFSSTSTYGGISLQMAGFDGRKTLIPWTNSEFTSNVTMLKDYINASMRDTGFTSTDLYSTYIEAIGILNDTAKEDAAFDGESYTTLIVFTDGTDRARRIASASVVAEVARSSSIDMFYSVAAVAGEQQFQFAAFLDLSGRDGAFSFDSTSQADLAAPLSRLVETLEIIMWQVWTKAHNAYVTSYCAAARAGATVHFEMQFTGTAVTQFEFNANSLAAGGVFDTSNVSIQCNEARYTAPYQDTPLADYATILPARSCNYSQPSVLEYVPADVVLEPVSGTPEIFTAYCSANMPCDTGFTCRQGFCVDMTTVRLQMVKSQQLAPANVQVAFSLVATLQNNTYGSYGNCGPVVYLDNEMTELASMITVRDETLDASTTEAATFFVPRPLEYRLKVFVLVDQSDSITVTTAAMTLAVKNFVNGLFDTENTRLYTAGIEVRIAGFDGRSTLITDGWTTDFYGSANMTELMAAIDAGMAEATFTSTNLYGAFIAAINELEAAVDLGASDGIMDYTSMVVMTDSTDRARINTITDARNKVDRSTIDTFFAVTVAGEGYAEFETFKDIAGKDGVYSTNNVNEDVSARLFWRMSLRQRNVYVFSYCSPLRSGTSTLELQFGTGAPILVEVNAGDFDTTNPHDQCNATTLAMCKGCDTLVDAFTTEANQRSTVDDVQSCDASSQRAYAFNATEVAILNGLKERYESYCPKVPCESGFSCVSGYCLDLNSTRLQMIDYMVEAPSDVIVGFSLVATLQGGGCGPVPLKWTDTKLVEDNLVIKEDNELASEIEAPRGLVARPLDFRLKVFLLIDQSDSVTDKAAVKDAVKGFIDGLFFENNADAYEGGIEIRIAGFDGRSTLIEWTDGMFQSNMTEILKYVDAAMMGPVFTSTDLYGPYMQAIDVLDQEHINTLNDTIADYSSLVVFTDGTDRARRHTLSEVRDKLAMSNISTTWVVPVMGESDFEYEEFQSLAGKDGVFPVDPNYAALKLAFEDLFWRISIRPRNIYILLYCPTVRSDTVPFSLGWGTRHEPATFNIDTSVFDTDNAQNQCDAARAKACVGCERVLRFAEKDGQENIREAQTCNCPPGYTLGMGVECVDVNECNITSDDCHHNAACNNTEGSFTCSCNLGYEGNGTVCNDIDECTETRMEFMDNCHVNATCNNTDGSFTCACDPGYQGEDGTFCENINECGGFVIWVPATNGTTTMFPINASSMFVMNPAVMGDVNGTGAMNASNVTIFMNASMGMNVTNGTEGYWAYLAPTDDCHPNATCSDTIGSFGCACNVGYEGNGTFCVNIDECALAIDDCAMNATCGDTDGSFTCTCDLGFEGNGTFCKDKDECMSEEDDCDDDATCTNVIGSFTCACNLGYNGTGVMCENIDECAQEIDNCDDLATCGDTNGSFTCTCNIGYNGSGVECFNIDECMLEIDDCAEMGSTCNDTMGSFTCACDLGWRGNGRNCSDIDECMEMIDDCHANATCGNTNGSFTCTCDAGYSGNGTMCMDIDECTIDDEELDDNCDVNAFCNNTEGSFMCTCGRGWMGDGVMCEDIDECEEETDNCLPVNGTCLNTNGSFTCACAPGFQGPDDGSVCTNINECETATCHINATCVDTMGSFECICDEGLKGNGTFCSENLIEFRELSSTSEVTGMTLAQFNTQINRDAYLAAVRQEMFDADWISRFTIDFRFGLISELPSGGLSIQIFIRIFALARSFTTFDIDYYFNLVSIRLEERVRGGFILTRLRGDIVTFALWNLASLRFGGLFKFQWSDARPRVWIPPTFNGLQLFRAKGVDRGLLSICGLRWGRGFQFGFFSNAMRLNFRRAFALFLNIDISWFQILRLGETISVGSDIEIMYEIISSRASISLTSLATRINTGFANKEIDTFLLAQGFNISGTELLLEPEVYECEVGYNATGANCTDIDECLADPCDLSATCTNNEGSFTCACNGGFSGDGLECENTDECSTNSSSCSVNAMCTDTTGSFTCECMDGFRDDSDDMGTICTNIDECTALTCEYEHIAVNCSNGTEWFVDLQENYTAPENCSSMVETYEADCAARHTCLAEGMFCIDTQGSFTCACSLGYNTTYNQTDGMLICENIDECAEETDDCHAQATCVDTPGSFECPCNPGWGGNGTVCRNLDECEDFADNNCNALSTCTDNVGSFTCVCDTNYIGNGHSSGCTFSPPAGTLIVTVTVTFTATINIQADVFRNNQTIRGNYLGSVARSANVEISVVQIISITTVTITTSQGRRLLQEEATQVETQVTMAEQQLNDIRGDFENNLRSSLSGNGIGMSALSSLDTVVPTTTPPPVEEEEGDDDDDDIDGGIIGGTVAGVLALLALCAAGVWFASKKKPKEAPYTSALVRNDVEQPPDMPQQPFQQPEYVAPFETPHYNLPKGHASPKAAAMTDLAFYAPPMMPPNMGSYPPVFMGQPGMMGMPMMGSVPPMGTVSFGSMPPMMPGQQPFPPMGM